MEKRIHFRRTVADQLIHLPVAYQYNQMKSGGYFVLDTGASHTVMDLNTLFFLGYRVEYHHQTVPIMTAGGIIQGYLIQLNSLECLGKKVDDFTVVGYDFLALGSTDTAEGMIGLDFLDQIRLQLDFIDNYVIME